jgi:hypothetical protein
MVRRETRNEEREITRVAKGLTKAGLPVTRTEFDPISGRVIYYHTDDNGIERGGDADHWSKFIRDEKAKRQNSPH